MSEIISVIQHPIAVH